MDQTSILLKCICRLIGIAMSDRPDLLAFRGKSNLSYKNTHNILYYILISYPARKIQLAYKT